MKTYSLVLAFLLSAGVANAQWSLNLQGGLQKATGLSRQPAQNFSVISDYVTASTGLAFGAYLVNEKAKTINLGLGLSLKTNEIKRFMRRNDGNYLSPVNKGVTELNVSHKSAFLSIHPIIDVNLDKNRYFHLLLNPVINFFVGGKENGYSSYTAGSVFYKDSYNNSSEHIKKLVLGMSMQMQFQYPFTPALKGVGALGYSINNTPGDFIPGESGNVSLQLGLKYAMRFAKKGTAATKDEADGEAK